METLIENHVNSGEDSSGELILSQASIYRHCVCNKKKSEQTADPSKYPQGRFNAKACKHCGSSFEPKAPSELYCSEECRVIGIQDAYLKRTYGITTEDYMAMHAEQKGLCKICNREGFTMDKRHKMKLVVDHDHATGAVRGLLCHNCNRALGLLQDDISVIESAVKYLKVQRLS